MFEKDKLTLKVTTRGYKNQKQKQKQVFSWRSSSSAGQALVPVIFFLLIGLLMLGLVVEVGHIFMAKQSLQNDADAAASYGAMQLDVTGVYDSDGRDIEVNSPGHSPSDPDQAGQRVADFMTSAGYQPSEYSWQWHRCSFQVKIERNVPFWFVSMFGVRQTKVSVISKSVLFDGPNGCDS